VGESEANEPLTALRVQELLLRQAGLRVGPEVAAYVLRRRQTAPGTPIPVMGADARTGVPVRREIAPTRLTTNF
jgi:hypothetical protein